MLKLSDLDKGADGGRPLAACLTWLDTLLKSPAVTWDEDQRQAAARALWEAQAIMSVGVMYLAPSPLPPLPMVLHCPACRMQHIDKAEPGRAHPYPPREPWNNPPHRSHLCAACGHQWRPADVPTVGVEATRTRGQNDSPFLYEARGDDNG